MQKIKDFIHLFMGLAPKSYKVFIIICLVLNPFLFWMMGSLAAGWAVLIEFLIILSLALKCYPLFPGGLVAIEALALKMVGMKDVMKEIHNNMDVVMLLIFLVPAIYFMKPFLVHIFMKVLSVFHNKILLSLIFLIFGAFLSAWLDALTVMVVMITVCAAVRDLYARVSAQMADDSQEFDRFLGNLLMHGAIGTALGGIATVVGEPQNLLIAHYAGWGFRDFYLRMAHFSIPLQLMGILVCFLLERFRLKAFGFGYQLSQSAGKAMADIVYQEHQQGPLYRTKLWIMAAAFVGLILALGLQIAPIGIIGLGLLIFLPVLTGQTDEHQIGDAFKESLPFTALLIVFFIIVAMIEGMGLFRGITDFVLHFNGRQQLYAFFGVTGLLSAVSDNVFVANVYIHEAFDALSRGVIQQEQFEKLAVMINAGTNIFSIVTPNGQAAFLFLLTSSIARRIGLSYVRMFLMSLPFAMALIGLAFVLI